MQEGAPNTGLGGSSCRVQNTFDARIFVTVKGSSNVAINSNALYVAAVAQNPILVATADVSNIMMWVHGYEIFGMNNETFFSHGPNPRVDGIYPTSTVKGNGSTAPDLMNSTDNQRPPIVTRRQELVFPVEGAANAHASYSWPEPWYFTQTDSTISGRAMLSVQPANINPSSSVDPRIIIYFRLSIKKVQNLDVGTIVTVSDMGNMLEYQEEYERIKPSQCFTVWYIEKMAEMAEKEDQEKKRIVKVAKLRALGYQVENMSF